MMERQRLPDRRARRVLCELGAVLGGFHLFNELTNLTQHSLRVVAYFTCMLHVPVMQPAAVV